MAGKAGLKAGLIGLAILLVTTLVTQLEILPISGALTYVMCGINSLVYIAIGVLAGFYLAPPRVPGKGAGAGAIAGLISGGMSSLVGSIIMSVRWARGMGIAGLDPQQMQQLTEAGMDPRLFAIPGVLCGLAMGAALAAIGGAILAAVKSD